MSWWSCSSRALPSHPGRGGTGTGCSSIVPAAQVVVAGLDAEQLANAQTIVAVGRQPGCRLRLGRRRRHGPAGVQPHNLDHGDRDSLGLFQQRAGWGDADRLDPETAARMFYAGGKGARRGWSRSRLEAMPLTERRRRCSTARSPTPTPRGNPSRTDRRQPSRAVRPVHGADYTGDGTQGPTQSSRPLSVTSAPRTAGAVEASAGRRRDSARARNRRLRLLVPGPVRLLTRRTWTSPGSPTPKPPPAPRSSAARSFEPATCCSSTPRATRPAATTTWASSTGKEDGPRAPDRQDGRGRPRRVRRPVLRVAVRARHTPRREHGCDGGRVRPVTAGEQRGPGSPRSSAGRAPRARSPWWRPGRPRARGRSPGERRKRPAGLLRRADPLVRGGAPSGTRTPNPLIKSQLLCQLS